MYDYYKLTNSFLYTYFPCFLLMRDNSNDDENRTSGCPFHQTNGRRGGESGEERGPNAGQKRLGERTVDRRSFMRTALAIGGTSALAAVSGTRHASGAVPELGAVDVPRGPTNPNEFPERQHAWNRDLKTDSFGNAVLPNHQLLLFLNYVGEDTQTGKERQEVERAFRTLELAFRRLTGGDHSADNDGLVFMVGYSHEYFDRFDAEIPRSIDLLRPETVLRETNDDPDKADHFDAVLVLSSDTVPVLLASEEALFGNLDSLNGVDVRGTLVDIFETAERRTAFVGKGLPREKLDNQNIHEDAPLSMGYKSGFKDNLATEDAVTITNGPFKEGTTFQVSKLRLDLGKWYENDRKTRDELMFSTEHSSEMVGEVGEKLEDDSKITEEIVTNLDETTKEHSRVGHAAKAAQSRDENFEPLILRRSEGINNSFHEDGKVDFNFTAVMERIRDFIETRQAMNAPDLDDHLEEDSHGILPFMEVTNRATFLIPPRKFRSLPRALPR